MLSPELLAALAVKDRRSPIAGKKLKNDLIALMQNLRAFAFSLCSQHERADDLVQETLLKAWRIAPNTHISVIAMLTAVGPCDAFPLSLSSA